MDYRIETRTNYALVDGDNSFDLPFGVDEYATRVLYTQTELIL